MHRHSGKGRKGNYVRDDTLFNSGTELLKISSELGGIPTTSKKPVLLMMNFIIKARKQDVNGSCLHCVKYLLTLPQLLTIPVSFEQLHGTVLLVSTSDICGCYLLFQK